MSKNKYYIEKIKEYDEIYNFLHTKKINEIKPLKSIWRANNLLLKITTDEGKYVFKKIYDLKKDNEIDKIINLKKTYGKLVTEVIKKEKNAYLMNFIDGKTFLEIPENEKINKINFAGKLLNKSIKKTNKKTDITKKVLNSLNNYINKRKNFFINNELKNIDLDGFTNVPINQSHNDLNMMNLFYTNDSIKLIDPSEEGFNDIARDVGRYCASCFFNYYDMFGNNKEKSLKIAEAFLSNFNEEILHRAKYYIGESFIAFLKFNTVTTPKDKLKKLAINTLTNKKNIIKILYDSI